MGTPSTPPPVSTSTPPGNRTPCNLSRVIATVSKVYLLSKMMHQLIVLLKMAVLGFNGLKHDGVTDMHELYRATRAIDHIHGDIVQAGGLPLYEYYYEDTGVGYLKVHSVVPLNTNGKASDAPSGGQPQGLAPRRGSV